MGDREAQNILELEEDDRRQEEEENRAMLEVGAPASNDELVTLDLAAMSPNTFTAFLEGSVGDPFVGGSSPSAVAENPLASSHS